MIWLVAVLPFISTLLGGIAVFRLQHRLHAVMAAAAGILVATALVDLLPESIELIGVADGPFLAGAAAVVGYLLYSAVEAFIHQSSYEHEHEAGQDPDAPHEHPVRATQARAVLGWLAPAGLIVHSVLDGLAIGLGFEAGTEVGVVVALAVVVHDFADGLNIVTLALAGGRGRAGAIVLLAFDALATIVGIGISQVVALAPEQLGIVLGGLAGAFVAIGAGHLLPEAQHRRGINVSPLIALTVLGAAVVIVTRLLLA
ncbi:MAG: ZIP family metal transporter [Chloroflexota bacterium]